MHFLWFRSTSLRIPKFTEIKERGFIFWGKQFFWMSGLFRPPTAPHPLLYFNFKSFLDPNSSPFISFQSIFFDSGVLLSEFSNLYKLRRGHLISVGNQFCRMPELFGPPSCISILKVLMTQSLHHSLHFNVLSMIQEYFSKSCEISTN